MFRPRYAILGWPLRKHTNHLMMAYLGRNMLWTDHKKTCLCEGKSIFIVRKHSKENLSQWKQISGVLIPEYGVTQTMRSARSGFLAWNAETGGQLPRAKSPTLSAVVNVVQVNVKKTILDTNINAVSLRVTCTNCHTTECHRKGGAERERERACVLRHAQPNSLWTVLTHTTSATLNFQPAFVRK
jgi:hypothetical protein